MFIIFGDDTPGNIPAQKGDDKPLNTLASPKAEETENSPTFHQSARKQAQIEQDKHLKKIVNIYNFAIEKIRENSRLLEVKEELEAQALQAEEIERYNPDPYVCEVINGKSYRMRKSQKAKLDYIVKKGLEEWQKALEEGKKVEIEIKIRYPSGSESKRSDKFIINSITTDEFGNRKLSKYEFYN